MKRGKCAKRHVECTIHATNGERITGANWCRNPQEACPREEGDDYEKCTTICGQYGHAEQVALFMAGDKAKGATASFKGHTYACKECQEALYDAGVIFIARDGGAA